MRLDLPQEWIDAALAARARAYAPYSNYAVGAAIVATSGAIHSGANVENASYGLTICAERSALFAAVSSGERAFQALVVATADGGPPCGACRQVLAEFADDLPIWTLDVSAARPPALLRLAELLPHRFKLARDGDHRPQ